MLSMKCVGRSFPREAFDMLKVGMIGKSGHAGRLIEIVRDSKQACLEKVYYPRRLEGADLPLASECFYNREQWVLVL